MNIAVLTKFLPRTLVRINSPINGEVSVVEQFGQRKIVIGGLTQSGSLTEEVWKEAIEELIKIDKKSQLRHFVNETNLNILILGLGGGSLVKLLKKYFPQAKIIGVEIDPIMIELGKNYLELVKFKNLKIEIADASDFIRRKALLIKKTKERQSLFDLIFVDLYLGDNVPENCQNELFLQNLKKISRKNGMVVFNRLYYKNHIFEAKIFLDKLEKIFNDLDCKKVLTNLFIFARR